MGIKSLLKFLSEFPNIIKTKKSEDYYGKKIAIDISILIYQVVIAIRNSGSDLTNDKGQMASHILGLFNKTLSYLDRGIIPVYVFDGKPPALKQKTLEMRKEIRKKAQEKLNILENINDNDLREHDEEQLKLDKIKYLKRSVWITKEHIDQCRELLNLMGIPYIDAPEEADSQLSYLCKNNLVYAVLTEDMDILTFGSPRIIRNLTSNTKEPIEIELNTVLETLNINYEQFVELCVLFGCDYCNHIIDAKPLEIFSSYTNNKSIEKTLIDLKNNGKNVPEMNYEDAKQYFFNAKHKVVSENNLKMKKPDINKLIDVLVNKHGLIKFKIKYKIDKLNNYYNKYYNF